MNWTEKDINKMKSAYLAGKREVECPSCGGKVTITKEEGEEYLNKKYVKTHFFLTFTCKGCGRWDTRTYQKSPTG